MSDETEQAQEMVNALAEAASLAESQNQALQQRINELEGILRAWRIDVSHPTQETDPE